MWTQIIMTLKVSDRRSKLSPGLKTDSYRNNKTTNSQSPTNNISSKENMKFTPKMLLMENK